MSNLLSSLRRTRFLLAALWEDRAKRASTRHFSDVGRSAAGCDIDLDHIHPGEVTGEELARPLVVGAAKKPGKVPPYLYLSLPAGDPTGVGQQQSLTRFAVGLIDVAHLDDGAID